MWWRLFVLGSMSTLMSGYRCEVTVQEAFEFLNNLYMRKNETGCGTPIKCDMRNATTTGTLMNSEDGHGIPCCYDCVGCQGDRCYTGWQCCKNDSDGNTSVLRDDPRHAYANTDEDFVTCENTFVYEKYVVEKGVFKTHFVYETPFAKPNAENGFDMGVSYQMISKCPANATNYLLKIECEHPRASGRVMELIPYISLKSYQIYRNLHCVKCHYGKHYPEAIVPFSLSLTEPSVNSYYRFSFVSMFLTVYDIYNFKVPNVSTDSLDATRILLKALPEFLDVDSNKLDIPVPCGKQMNVTVDVNDCQDDTHNNLSRKACALFYSPIRLKQTSQPYNGGVYRNIGCAYCKLPHAYSINTITTRHDGWFGKTSNLPQCTAENSASARMVFDLFPIMQISKTNKPSVKYENTVIFVEQPSFGKEPLCQIGYFYDPYTDKCRHILCPRRQFIYRGRCRHVFRKAVRQTFYIKIKLSSKELNLKPDIIFINSIQNNITAIFKQGVNLSICDVKRNAKLTDDIFFEYVIFEYWLLFKQIITYGDVISFLKPLFYNKLLSDIQESEGILLESGSVAFNAQGKSNPPLYDADDGQTIIKLPQRGPNKYTFTHLCSRMAAPISNLDYCYQVLLDLDEYDVTYHKGRTHFRLHIKKANIFIHRDNIETVYDGRLRVCIEDYVAGLSQNESLKFPAYNGVFVDITTTDASVKDNTTTTITNGKEAMFADLLIYVVLFITVLLFYCVV